MQQIFDDDSGCSSKNAGEKAQEQHRMANAQLLLAVAAQFGEIGYEITGGFGHHKICAKIYFFYI